jgi:hypothetical protein
LLRIEFGEGEVVDFGEDGGIEVMDKQMVESVCAATEGLQFLEHTVDEVGKDVTVNA